MIAKRKRAEAKVQEVPKRSTARGSGSRVTTKASESSTGVQLQAQRGSLVCLRHPPEGCSELAVIVSNDIQNEVSCYVLAVPLQRRVSRLRAPFAVDMGRDEGLRELHVARADWLTRITSSDIKSIERASFPEATLSRLELALKAALSLS